MSGIFATALTVPPPQQRFPRRQIQHLRTNFRQTEKFCYVLVVKADATVRGTAPDLARVVGAVDAVELPGCGIAWVPSGLSGPRNIVRPLRITLLHGGRRAPSGPRPAHDFGSGRGSVIPAQRHAGRKQTIGAFDPRPEVKRARSDVHKDRALAGVLEIGRQSSARKLDMLRRKFEDPSCSYSVVPGGPNCARTGVAAATPRKAAPRKLRRSSLHSAAGAHACLHGA